MKDNKKQMYPTLARLLSIGLLIAAAQTAQAQQQPASVPYKEVHIGEQVPDIPFQNAKNFPPQAKTLSHFNGKLVVLDFWATTCAACIKAFPKMARLQQQFGDQLQVILINPWDKKEAIETKLRSLKHPDQIAALSSLLQINGDTLWRVLFPHQTVPHHVWIGKDGKVVSITDGGNASEDNIQKVLNGEKVNMLEKVNLAGYDMKRVGFIKQGHEKLPSPEFYSAFLPYQSGIGSGSGTVADSTGGTFRATLRNLKITQLYQHAIPGFAYRTLFQTKGGLRYEDPAGIEQDLDGWKMQHLFSYEIMLPFRLREYYKHYMKVDLDRFFAARLNLVGNKEKRKFPAYVLVRLDDKPISTTLDSALIYVRQNTDQSGLTAHTIRQLRFLLREKLEDLEKNIAFVDETNLKDDTPVSIPLPQRIDDLSPLRDALRKVGLDLVKEPRDIEVLIVRAASPGS